MRYWEHEHKKTQAEIIREHGYECLVQIGAGTLKTIDPKTKSVVMKEYTSYSASVNTIEVRIMVCEKINDIKIISNMMENYHVVVNEKDWMLLQSKNEL